MRCHLHIEHDSEPLHGMSHTQFPCESHTAETEVVDVVCFGVRVVIEVGDVGHDAHDVFECEGRVLDILFRSAESESAVEMEAADARKVVAFGGKDGIDVIARIVAEGSRADIVVIRVPGMCCRLQNPQTPSHW